MANTGSLLDEYQYDDEETIDLLNAIKNWNLKRPPASPPDHDGAASASLSLSSTIGTASDFDTITAVSTNTSKGGFTVSSASKLTPKTPMSNYSSKPSSLTARILQDVFPIVSNPDPKNNPVPNTYAIPKSNDNVSRFNDENQAPTNVTLSSTLADIAADIDAGNGNEFDEKLLVTPSNPRTTSSKTSRSSTAKQQATDINNGASNNINNENIRLSHTPQYVNTTHDSTDALEILRKTAAELGLSNDQLGAVLPTVQKLVKIITQHVPRLEHFVEQVCDVVMEEDQLNPTMERFNTPSRRHKKKNRKNIKARKERMDTAVCTLEKHWNRNHVGREDKLVFKEVDGNVMNESCDVEQELKEVDGNVMNESFDAEQELSLDYHDYHSYGIFTTAVKEHLSRHRLSNVTEVMTPVASNKDHISSHSQVLTDTEALKEINRLIDFEEKYGERVNGMIHSGDEVSDSPALSSNASPPQSDTVLSDLLSADTTTLRRFVLHFAYLFTVRQESILQKMNDLYVFSHEATSLIHDVKTAMGVSPNCPIHSVARQVVAMIEHTQKT